MQIKTRLFFICSCLISILLGFQLGTCINNYKANVESQSEIAEIESVIDEPQQIYQVVYITVDNREEIDVISSDENGITSLFNQPNEYRDLIDSLTIEDKELICRIAYLECGNQMELGQRAVIEVILNRMLDEKFPDTAYGVLSAPGQFTTWRMRNCVSQEQVLKMMKVLDTVYKRDEIVLTTDYLYFARGVFSFTNPDNNVQIQDHWFGTR